MKYHVIYPHGDVATKECGRAGLPDIDMRQIVEGHIEVVHVLFNDQRCDMIVNETGCMKGMPALPINARATAIYWTATREGRTPLKWEPLTMPLVHGVAILYEGTLP